MSVLKARFTVPARSTAPASRAKSIAWEGRGQVLSPAPDMELCPWQDSTAVRGPHATDKSPQNTRGQEKEKQNV